jgi:hypothetical protein
VVILKSFRLYGVGTGQIFLLGDYLADLPRAVGERIGGEVAKRLASESGDNALKGYAMQPGSVGRRAPSARVLMRTRLVNTSGSVGT